MTVMNQHEVLATLEKIRLLEARYTALQGEPVEDQHVRDLSLRSLKRTINQMREEVLRFQTAARATHDAV